VLHHLIIRDCSVLIQGATGTVAHVLVAEFTGGSESECYTQRTKDYIEEEGRYSRRSADEGGCDGADEAYCKPCEVKRADMRVAAADALVEKAGDGPDGAEENEGEEEGEGGSGSG
jgi:hypothetical protein